MGGCSQEGKAARYNLGCKVSCGRSLAIEPGPGGWEEGRLQVIGYSRVSCVTGMEGSVDPHQLHTQGYLEQE